MQNHVRPAGNPASSVVRPMRRTTLFGNRTMELMRSGALGKSSISRDGLVSGGNRKRFPKGSDIVPPKRLAGYWFLVRWCIALAELLIGKQLIPAPAPFFIILKGGVKLTETVRDPATGKPKSVCNWYGPDTWQECLRVQMWAWEKSNGTAELPLAESEADTWVVFPPYHIGLWLMIARYERSVSSLRAQVSHANDMAGIAATNRTLLGIGMRQAQQADPPSSGLQTSQGTDELLRWLMIQQNIITAQEVFASSDSLGFTHLHLNDVLTGATRIIDRAFALIGEQPPMRLTRELHQHLNGLQAEMEHLLSGPLKDDLRNNDTTQEDQLLRTVFAHIYGTLGVKAPHEQVVETDNDFTLETLAESMARGT